MAVVEITALAQEDLADIASYSIEQWGAEKARQYADFLDAHFALIASSEAYTKAPIPHRPEYRSSRCKKHVVFHQVRENAPPLIIAIFHERMDLMTRLIARL